MRLLERQSDGHVVLRDFTGRDVPAYAILSHTWNKEEVTFQDVEAGTGKHKAGWKKIDFCAIQADADSLQYFWVDTCCINKSSDAELSEAINSMYRWYSRASKCYVYLSDVSTSEMHDNTFQLAWDAPFRESKWFSRGWTLQELLAPSSVEFFSRNHKRLGNKSSLSQQIHEITGITLSALQGTSLSHFSVDERFKWAKDRHTTREEDSAYCLLGIFNISMPVIYGEGRDRAVNRLRKEINESMNMNSQDLMLHNILKHISAANDAPFNSQAKQHEPTCLQETRVNLLQDIDRWATGQDECCVFWLSGLAGTGKSTIARTIARKHYDQKKLGASFFFSRGGGDVGNASKFVTSIAIQLASSERTVCQNISEAVLEHSNIRNLSLRDQWRMLVIAPLSKLASNANRSSFLMVVDALDECDDYRDVRTICQLFADAEALRAARLRIFLTSRPEVSIRHGLSQIPDSAHEDFILHNISRSIVDHDIFIFLEQTLKIIAQERSLALEWPGKEAVSCMVQKANGLFIWAATACKFIYEGQRFAAKRLDIILRDSSGSAVTALEKHLDEIYIAVLTNSMSPEYTDEEKEEAYHTLKQILGSIAVLSSPFSTSSLTKLLGLAKEDICQTLEDLHSVLDISNDENRPFRLHHPSFRDFLLDENRSKLSKFWVDEKQIHQSLADRCLRQMSSTLKQDIYSFRFPGILAADADSSLIEKHLPLEVQYACLYWVHHLKKGGIELINNDQVHQFLNEHLLHWLEALGWMRRVPDGVLAAIQLESIVLSKESGRDEQSSSQNARTPTLLPKKPECEYKRYSRTDSSIKRIATSLVSTMGLSSAFDKQINNETQDSFNLYSLIHDMKRFALYSRPAIEKAPLQVYSSALLFAPTKSIVRRQFEERTQKWIHMTPTTPDQWDATLMTLEGHCSSVNSVAFSLDGTLVASSSHDGTIKLWDAESGKLRTTLEGHYDGEVTTSWFRGHFGKSVSSVVFSPDDKRLASGSLNGTVKLWDTDSGQMLEMLTTCGGSVNSVAFSPNGKLLALGSSEVQLWDAESCKLLVTLNGHDGCVMSVAFSPDGRQLVSGSYCGGVKLWYIESSKLHATLTGHSGHYPIVKCVSFSPNGEQVASCSQNGSVKLWNSKSGELLAFSTFPSPICLTTSLAFSLDGKKLLVSDASGIVLLDANSGNLQKSATVNIRSVNSIAFSRYGKLASGSHDYTVKLWDLEGCRPWATLGGDNGDNNNRGIAASIAISSGSKSLATGLLNGDVKLWDARSGKLQFTIAAHKNERTSAVAFSPDGTWLASGSHDNTIKLWVVESGKLRGTLESHTGHVYSVAFSLDGKRLASGSKDGTAKIWDFESHKLQKTLRVASEFVQAVAFSPDGERLATGSLDGTVKLWNCESYEELQRLKLGAAINHLAFSVDGSYLISNKGIIRPDPNVPTTTDQPELFVSGDWIMLGSQRLLWLPREYRANCFAVEGPNVVIGHWYGSVSYSHFECDKMNLDFLGFYTTFESGGS